MDLTYQAVLTNWMNHNEQRNMSDATYKVKLKLMAHNSYLSTKASLLFHWSSEGRARYRRLKERTSYKENILETYKQKLLNMIDTCYIYEKQFFFLLLVCWVKEGITANFTTSITNTIYNKYLARVSEVPGTIINKYSTCADSLVLNCSSAS